MAWWRKNAFQPTHGKAYLCRRGCKEHGTQAGKVYVNKSKAEADEAIENWKIAVKNREYADETYEQRVLKLTEEIALIQKEGAVND